MCGHTCLERNCRCATMPTSRDPKSWFFIFLMFSSGVPQAEIPSYDNFLRYCFQHTSMKTEFRRKLMPSSVLHSTVMWINPFVWQLVKQLTRQRQFEQHPGAGFWEKDVQGTWAEQKFAFPDWEDKQYLDRHRVTKAKHQVEKTNKCRQALCNYSTLACLFNIFIGIIYNLPSCKKASIVSIVHERMYVLCQFLVLGCRKMLLITMML